MKKHIFNYGALAFAALLMGGCNDAANSALTENRAFIRNSFEQKIGEVYVDKDEDAQLIIPINLTHKDDRKEIAVSIGTDEALIQEYNTRNKRAYKMYPSDMFSFEANTVNIPKGQVGTSVTLNVKPLTEELIASGDLYVIPVTLTGSDVGTLDGASSMLYIVRDVPYANVAQTYQQRLKFPADRYGEQMRFEAMTIEFLFKIDSWQSRNNCGLFYNNGITYEDGGQIFSRLEGGSSGLDKAQLDFSIGESQLNAVPPSGKFETGKWYHVAMVWGNMEMLAYINGIQMGRKEVARTQILASTAIEKDSQGNYGTSHWDGFCWEGLSSDSQNVTQISELRLWNVKRTREQIQENMYRVNPQSQGLLLYYKFNEGAGNSFIDSTSPDTEPGFVQKRNDITWLLEQNTTVGQ
jgi:hypothetical protein